MCVFGYRNDDVILGAMEFVQSNKNILKSIEP